MTKPPGTTRLLLALAGLALISSCTTTRYDSAVTAAPELPADVAMNKGAGRGMVLMVTVRMENGDEFPCAVDTGAPASLLPGRLEPQLGKRVGAWKFSTLDSTNEIEHLYLAPKLYLGATPLVTGSRIGTWGQPYGVLGMDCLCHYCIQLDFETGKIRFLDSEGLNTAELGKAYPLKFHHYVYIHRSGLLGGRSSRSFIDTGCWMDGLEPAGRFRREFARQRASLVPILKDGQITGSASDVAYFPASTWDGNTYTNLVIQKGESCLGLKFLARHLVTLNFPKRVMYLKTQ